MIEPKESGYFWYLDDCLQNKIICKVTINSANEPDVEFFKSDYGIMRYNKYSEEELRDLHPEFTKVEPELVFNRNGKNLEECLRISQERVIEIIKRCREIVYTSLRTSDNNGEIVVKVVIDNNFSLKEKIFAVGFTTFGLCRDTWGIL